MLLIGISCYSITHNYGGSKELTPGTKLTRPSEKVGEIEGGASAWFLLWGIVPLSRANGPQLAATLADDKCGPASWDGITHLHITEELDGLGATLMFFSLGLVSRYTVSISGEIDHFAK